MLFRESFHKFLIEKYFSSYKVQFQIENTRVEFKLNSKKVRELFRSISRCENVISKRAKLNLSLLRLGVENFVWRKKVFTNLG